MSESPPTISLDAHLKQMAMSAPDRLAIIHDLGTEAGGKARYDSLTFAQLDSRCDQLVCGLEGIGVAPGMRVVLMVRPGIEFFSLTFALFRLGAVIVLIDPGMGRKNLGACIDEAAPEAFIGISQAHAARIVLGWARSSAKIFVTVGRRWFWGGCRYQDLLREPNDKQPSTDARSDDTAAILYTSGSTGAPKGVIYTHQIFSAQIDFLKQEFKIEPGETDLATFPLFALFDPALGMTAVIPDMNASQPAKADPQKLLRAITDHRVTQMFGSPALMDRLSRYCESKNIKLPTLRRVLSAGAPVRTDILRRLTGILNPDVEIVTPYGATEALPVCRIEGRTILDETCRETERGKGICVGQPINGVEVRIIEISEEPIEHWRDSLELEPGKIGEIAVSGPTVTREYFNRPRETTLAKIRSSDDKFYHRMGDVGWIDAGGRLWFCGRKKHRVTTPDETLFTIPCESIFNTHSSVLRTALVGIGEPGQQRPVLCVELEPASTNDNREAIISELLEIGTRQAVTKAIRTILFHPAFPVDVRHNAKINREELAAWAAKQLK